MRGGGGARSYAATAPSPYVVIVIYEAEKEASENPGSFRIRGAAFDVIENAGGPKRRRALHVIIILRIRTRCTAAAPKKR